MFYALQNAAKDGNVEEVQKQLKKKKTCINDNTPIGTALRLASEHGHTDVVKLLLEPKHKCDVNAVNRSHGHSALHWACDKGYVEIVKLLLKANGINKGIHDDHGQTGLHLASMNGHVEVVKVLLEKGVEVNEADKKGQTPLHLACDVKKNIKVVKVLLSKGADVTACDNKKNTPLHVVCAMGDAVVAAHLIMKGADMDAKAKGKTPIQKSSGKHFGYKIAREMATIAGVKPKKSKIGNKSSLKKSKKAKKQQNDSDDESSVSENETSDSD